MLDINDLILEEAHETVYFNAVIAITEANVHKKEGILLHISHVELSEDLRDYILENPYLEDSWTRNLPKEAGVYTCKLNMNGDGGYTPDSGYEYDEWVELTDVVKVLPFDCLDIGICKEEGCQEKATTDYNGRKYYVCDYHDRKLNDEFEDEYR